MTQLKEQIKAARSRAYSLKTKKAQTKAWAAVRELEREALTLLYAARDRYATQSIKGTVVRFTDSDDHVCVTTALGTMWISPTSDAVSKSWYGQTCCVQYSNGQEIIIEIETDVNSDRLFLELIPRRVFGGTLNEAKYTELCKRTNLAFFKYPNGHMSGLFASKAGA